MAAVAGGSVGDAALVWSSLLTLVFPPHFFPSKHLQSLGARLCAQQEGT